MKLDKEFLEKHSIKAAIFDMDGLLIDSEPLWQEAEISIFTKLGVPLTAEMTNQTMGLRVDEVVEYWFAKYPWKEISKVEIATRIVDRVVQLIAEKGLPMPGAIELLKYLHGVGMPMAIASSSRLNMIEAVVKRFGIGKYIKGIASAEFEKKGKPDPAVYITAAKKLGIEPKYCLTFEDSINGVKSAKSAGTICIAIPDNNMKDDERFSIADFKVDSLLKLL